MTHEDFNSVERLWQNIKKLEFSLISGEEERRLKVLFIQGLYAGQFFVSEIIARETPVDATEAITRFRQQISAEMERLGYRQKQQHGPKVVAHIDGQRIKDN